MTLAAELLTISFLKQESFKSDLQSRDNSCWDITNTWAIRDSLKTLWSVFMESNLNKNYSLENRQSREKVVTNYRGPLKAGLCDLSWGPTQTSKDPWVVLRRCHNLYLKNWTPLQGWRVTSEMEIWNGRDTIPAHWFYDQSRSVHQTGANPHKAPRPGISLTTTLQWWVKSTKTKGGCTGLHLRFDLDKCAHVPDIAGWRGSTSRFN